MTFLFWPSQDQLPWAQDKSLKQKNKQKANCSIAAVRPPSDFCCNSRPEMREKKVWQAHVKTELQEGCCLCAQFSSFPHDWFKKTRKSRSQRACCYRNSKNANNWQGGLCKKRHFLNKTPKLKDRWSEFYMYDHSHWIKNWRDRTLHPLDGSVAHLKHSACGTQQERQVWKITPKSRQNFDWQ